MPFTDDRDKMRIPLALGPGPARGLPQNPEGAWPPPVWDPILWDMKCWAAWWGGDCDALMRTYYALGGDSPIARSYFATTGEPGLPTPRPGQYRGGLLGSVRRWYHGIATPPGEKRNNIHLPLAGDIASSSASLLFSQPPALKHEAGGQDYLTGLVDDGTHATFLEGAEHCAAMGGVYLRVTWDTDVSDHPWIDLVPADAAVPEFRGSKLVAVTFWTVLRDEGKTVIRHLEKHIPGRNAILHGVYVGEQDKIGTQAPLGDFWETAPYAQMTTEGNAITFPDQPKDASTVVYVPNMRPNRIWRDLGPHTAPLGRSDYSGLETDLDALDEAYGSWMRDIRLGKARLIVPSSYIDNIGRGKGGIFEPEREVFVPVAAMVSGEGTMGQQIMAQQFDIRWQAHQQTVSSMMEMIIQMAGYSGQTLGIQGDVAQTATEVVARERKSLTTRGKKITYWRPALADILYGLMSIEQSVFHMDITPVRPDVEFPDVVQPDQLELAQTVSALRGAEAASVETAVAMVHPDWSPEKVGLEVQRIYEEVSLDMLSRARISLSTTPGEDLGQELAEIPGAVGTTDIASQVVQDAASTDQDQDTTGQ